MHRKMIFILFLCAIIFPIQAGAQSLSVNNQTTEQGSTVYLFQDNLDAGKIVFTLLAPNISKAEITLDKGRSWQEMALDRDQFSFKYRPLSNEVIYPEFLLTSTDGAIKTYRADVKVSYLKYKPEEQIEQILDKFKTFYENEEQDRFMALFSSSFPERMKFEEAIQNDFYNYRDIRLLYRIDSKSFDTDYSGAVWDIYWQRKYSDRDGNVLTDSTGTISMRFDNEGEQWMITGLRNNTIFGSSLLTSSTVKTDLAIATSDISGGYGPSTYIVSAVVHNNGSVAANNFKVRFRATAGAAFDDTVNVETIAAGSQATVQYSTSEIPPFTVEVTVDSTNVIPETDKTNNTASKSLP